MSITESNTDVEISTSALAFVEQRKDSGNPTRSLRVCCYGSSSSSTPSAYLQEARDLGYLLAKRGHVCVNGAGSFGCMAALNDGAVYGNGHIIGVIHEMWMTNENSSTENAGNTYNGVPVRDGGAHNVFDNQSNKNAGDNVHREILVARGKDLQERKRLLVKDANALVVLPGGPGTWDELWEMACARNIGLSKLPIVCVNVQGYYEPFRAMLQRAYDEELTKTPPEQLVHFCDSALQAMEWVEANAVDVDKPPVIRKSVVRKSSMLHMPALSSGRRSFSFWSSKDSGSNDQQDNGEDTANDDAELGVYDTTPLLFLASGFILGLVYATSTRRR